MKPRTEYMKLKMEKTDSRGLTKVAENGKLQKHRILNVYSQLWKSNAKLDITDTIEISHEHDRTAFVHWYFTSKSGLVLQKKSRRLDEVQIQKAFLQRFHFHRKAVLTDTTAEKGIIAILSHVVSVAGIPAPINFQTMTMSDFKSWTRANGPKDDEQAFLLQYQHPGTCISCFFNDQQPVVFTKSRLSTTSWAGRKHIHVPTHQQLTSNPNDDDEGKRTRTQVQIARRLLKKFIHLIQKQTDEKLIQLQLDYILTMEGRVIVSTIHHLIFASDLEQSVHEMEDAMAENLTTKKKNWISHNISRMNENNSCAGEFCAQSQQSTNSFSNVQRKSIELAAVESWFLYEHFLDKTKTDDSANSSLMASSQQRLQLLQQHVWSKIIAEAATRTNRPTNMKKRCSMDLFFEFLTHRGTVLTSRDPVSTELASNIQLQKWKYPHYLHEPIQVCQMCYSTYRSLDQKREEALFSTTAFSASISPQHLKPKQVIAYPCDTTTDIPFSRTSTLLDQLPTLSYSIIREAKKKSHDTMQPLVPRTSLQSSRPNE